ncbi:sulfurtransferase TusA family protein [Phenylobacterium parvum]|uniref:SirA family protein n=1 Tax=Phenylobacterium parvum TaxID=2201350 RepID=A0A2Z3HNY9_9CAUL|nr:sulfurtransferase TusA family protein [Phenylobacterium parvum]AWM77447.1 SirA family protein [Phenylobacterium parvum]
MTGESGDIIVDARGHHCPVPTLRLRRALETADAGGVVRLLADDPMARIDVPHFVQEAGLELLEGPAAEGPLSFRVRKPHPEAGSPSR